MYSINSAKLSDNFIEAMFAQSVNEEFVGLLEMIVQFFLLILACNLVDAINNIPKLSSLNQSFHNISIFKLSFKLWWLLSCENLLQHKTKAVILIFLESEHFNCALILAHINWCTVRFVQPIKDSLEYVSHWLLELVYIWVECCKIIVKLILS